jgi:hypothetical protein
MAHQPGNAHIQQSQHRQAAQAKQREPHRIPDAEFSSSVFDLFHTIS